MICNKRLSDVMLLVFDFGRKSTVTFSKGCLDALGDPEYVLVMIHLEKRTLMLVKAEKGGARSKKPKGYRVEKNDEGAYVMENCDLFLSKVAELMVWKTDRSTKMFFMGRENDGKVVFELSEHQEIGRGATQMPNPQSPFFRSGCENERAAPAARRFTE